MQTEGKLKDRQEGPKRLVGDKRQEGQSANITFTHNTEKKKKGFGKYR